MTDKAILQEAQGKGLEPGDWIRRYHDPWLEARFRVLYWETRSHVLRVWRVEPQEAPRQVDRAPVAAVPPMEEQKEVPALTFTPCPSCDGYGGWDDVVCGRCGGSGWV